MSTDLSLYLVTDTAQCGSRGVPAVVAAAVAGGVRTVQIRDHAASAADLVALTCAVAAVLDGRTSITLLVDDRVDVVLAARLNGARVDGVHLGQSDLPATARGRSSDRTRSSVSPRTRRSTSPRCARCRPARSTTSASE